MAFSERDLWMDVYMDFLKVELPQTSVFDAVPLL